MITAPSPEDPRAESRPPPRAVASCARPGLLPAPGSWSPAVTGRLPRKRLQSTERSSSGRGSNGTVRCSRNLQRQSPATGDQHEPRGASGADQGAPPHPRTSSTRELLPSPRSSPLRSERSTTRRTTPGRGSWPSAGSDRWGAGPERLTRRSEKRRTTGDAKAPRPNREPPVQAELAAFATPPGPRSIAHAGRHGCGGPACADAA